MKKEGVLYRGGRSKFLHFLYLLPMLIGYRPLLVRFQWIHFVVYTAGFFMLLALVILSNRVPYILYDEECLRVLLEYREAREVHRFDEILGYYRKKPNLLLLFSLEHKPLRLRMGRQVVNELIETLEDRGIQAVEKEIADGKA